MNKSILSFMCVGLCAVACAEETAFVGQTMGAIEVTSTTANTIVAVAFNELSPVDEKDITAANLVSSKNLTDGDEIHIFTNPGYATWRLVDKKWVAPTKAFYANANGQQEAGDTLEPSQVGSKIGTGFWLVRKGGNLTQPFYIYGACVSATLKKAASGVKTLMGNPTSQDCAPSFSSPNNGDKIGICNADGTKLKEYTYSSSENSWGYMGRKEMTPYQEFKKISIPVIPKGTGFWYNNVGPNEVEVSWTN